MLPARSKKSFLLLSRNLLIIFYIWLIGGWPTIVFALPQDGQIVGGSGTITEPTTTSMEVQQNTSQMIINWQSFNIGAAESVNFSQPSSSSVALNRVIGTDPSLLLGNLTANGQVFITNGSGVFFGPGSQIDTHGLVATTMSISNQDFLDRNYSFTQQGPLSSVINEGNISATSYVGLLAPAVENRGTIVTASLGSIDLASGKAATMDFTGDGLIQFEVTEAVSGTVTDKDGNVLEDRVSNTGLLKADGGQIRMTAKDAGDVIRHVINMEGMIEANTVSEEDGWVIFGGGDSGIVHVSGTIDASGDDAGERGGNVEVRADVLLHSGDINAGGDTAGGFVTVNANKIQQSGSINTDGTDGGAIDIDFSDNYIAMEASELSATGNGADGGSIKLNGSSTGRLFTSGRIDTSSTNGIGGNLELFGSEVLLVAAKIDASGDNGGGSIYVGGDFQGQGTVPLSSATTVSGATTINADAKQNGNGGEVVVWSEGNTEFFGTVTARGGAILGNGGTIEISGKGNLAIGGTTDASAANGMKGTLLLDPKNIVVDDSSGGLPFFDLTDPNANGTSYGDTIATLANGNIVILDINDDFGASAAGAVYLYNGSTGALINTVTGTSVNDQVGFGQGIKELTGGNFVIASRNWDNGGTADVGAVTVISGTLGTTVTGAGTTVTTSNSLHGTTASDQVGISSSAILSNGNFAVGSAFWDGGVVNAGAVTLVSGTTGQAVADSSFVVSTSNSLHGTTANDQIGNNSTTALSNGNYVVTSQTWDGAAADVGSATLVSGTTGKALADSSFVVSTSNSIHGTTASDQVGRGNIKELSSGNYVVISMDWNGVVTDGGAVTLVSGTTGSAVANSSFVVSTSNSVHGTNSGDMVGDQGVTVLGNSNFAVASQRWDGVVSDGGAVTLVSGSTGSAVANSSFVVSTSNSIHGTTSGDNISTSGVTALTSSGTFNFVVASSVWDGGVVDAGAVTLVNGTTGLAVGNSSFVVSTSNSMYGTTASDNVGGSTVVALNNGDFVVRSEVWDGGVVDAGAVTLVSGTTGQAIADSSFVVSTSNSIHGTTTTDAVGSGQTIGLTNGNFTVTSHLWDNGGTANVGTVTLVSGTTGSAVADSSFVVSTSNSIYGSTANDQIGVQGVIEHTNSNFVVKNSLWDNGGTADAGAVTLVSGTTGKGLIDDSFIVSVNNSLVGTAASAGTGVAVTDSTNNFFVAQFKDNTTNRIRVAPLNDPTFSLASGVTYTIHSGFITNTLDAGTAVTLQASNDITINSAIVANNGSGAGGNLTLQAGRSILINANITTDDGNLILIANDLLANGVIDADRDAGAAAITMAGSTTLNAGAGNITIDLRAGTGKTNLTSGDITLDGVSTTGTLSVSNNGATAGSDIAQTAGWTVSGTSALTVTGDGAMTLANAANAFSGAMTLSADTGAVQIQSTGAGTLAASTLGGALTFQFDDGLTITGNITTAGATDIRGNDDLDSVGTLTINDGVTISTTNNTLLVAGIELDMNSTGKLNSGTSSTQIASVGTMGVGNANCGSTCQMTISGTELANITANNFTIGSGAATSIFVDGVTTANLANVSGNIAINAQAATGQITFTGSASTFTNLTAQADNGITLDVDLTSTTGTLGLYADIDTNGGSSFSIASGVTLTSAADMTLAVFSSTISAAGSLDLSAVNGITFISSLTTLGRLTINADSNTDGTGTLTISASKSINSSNNELSQTFATQSFGSGSTVNAGSGAVTRTFTSGSLTPNPTFVSTFFTAGTMTVNVNGDITFSSAFSTSDTTNIAGEISFISTTGDITVTAAQEFNHGFTLKAANDIKVQANLTTVDGFTAVADNDSSGAGNFTLDSGATVTASAGDISITGYEINQNGTITASGSVSLTETKPLVSAEEEEQISQGTQSTFAQDFAEPAGSSGC